MAGVGEPVQKGNFSFPPFIIVILLFPALTHFTFLNMNQLIELRGRLTEDAREVKHEARGQEPALHRGSEVISLNLLNEMFFICPLGGAAP